MLWRKGTEGGQDCTGQEPGSRPRGQAAEASTHRPRQQHALSDRIRGEGTPLSGPLSPKPKPPSTKKASDKPKDRTSYRTLAGAPPNRQGHNDQKRLRNGPGPEETKLSEDTGRFSVLGEARAREGTSGRNGGNGNQDCRWGEQQGTDAGCCFKERAVTAVT